MSRVKIIAELPPFRRGKLEDYLNQVLPLVGLVSHVDIPESTFGNPSASSVALGVLIKSRLGLDVIANVRVGDHNRIGLASLVLGGLVGGVKEFLLVRGDFGPNVKPVDDLDPLQAIGYLREVTGGEARLGVAIGRFDEDYVRSRLGARPDFAMIQYTLSINDLLKIARLGDEYGVELYAPLIVLTPRTCKTVSRIMGVEVKPPEDPIEDAVRRGLELLRHFPGVYVSAPGDFEALVRVVKRLREELRP